MVKRFPSQHLRVWLLVQFPVCRNLKALILPHAGYIYSGPIAATAYASLAPAAGKIRRVVLLGPSHRVAFEGMALSSARAFRTPLGDVPIDREACARIATPTALTSRPQPPSSKRCARRHHLRARNPGL